MKLQDTIKYDILDYFIKSLKQEILMKISHIQYGMYRYEFDISYQDKKMEEKNLGKLKIKLLRDPNWGDLAFEIPVKRIRVFWRKLTEDEKAQNTLYELAMNRYFEEIRQEEISRNEKLIKGLPKDKQKNILRELKLKRIVSENESNNTNN